MIMNYHLMQDNWLPVSIAKEDRLKYYQMLETYAVSGNIQPFAAFVAELEAGELDRMIALIQQVSGNGHAKL
jgi:hypothetical protein